MAGRASRQVRELAGDLSDAGYALKTLDESALQDLTTRHGCPGLVGSFAQVVQWCQEEPASAVALLREMDASLQAHRGGKAAAL